MAADESTATAEMAPIPPETDTAATESTRVSETTAEVDGEGFPAAEAEEPIESETLTGEEPAPGEAREAVDAGEFARDILDRILQGMGVPARVSMERQVEGAVRLLVEGEDMGVVIGKHGGTINALQYLVRLIVLKHAGEQIRLVIDAEGYRSRREQALRDMAKTYAQRVKESGQEAVLDALLSYERRIIHNCLSDDPDVFTYSEGEEPDRRVVISPREAAEA